MRETVKMMKEADVHPDQVAEFERHGWVVVDAEHGNEGDDEVQDAQPDTEVKPSRKRRAVKQ